MQNLIEPVNFTDQVLLEEQTIKNLLDKIRELELILLKKKSYLEGIFSTAPTYTTPFRNFTESLEKENLSVDQLFTYQLPNFEVDTNQIERTRLFQKIVNKIDADVSIPPYNLCQALIIMKEMDSEVFLDFQDPLDTKIQEWFASEKKYLESVISSKAGVSKEETTREIVKSVLDEMVSAISAPKSKTAHADLNIWMTIKIISFMTVGLICMVSSLVSLMTNTPGMLVLNVCAPFTNLMMLGLIGLGLGCIVYAGFLLYKQYAHASPSIDQFRVLDDFAPMTDQEEDAAFGCDTPRKLENFNFK